MFNIFKSKPTCSTEDCIIGVDCDGNAVFRCEKTKLLYVYGQPPKRYISVSKVIFEGEDGYEVSINNKKE